jgi:hypothetical protein
MRSLTRFLYVKFQGVLAKGGFKIPRLGGQDINLAQLYRSVLRCGGYHRTILNKGSWKRVSAWMCVPKSVTNSAYMLRVNYEKFLYSYETTFWKKGLIIPDEGIEIKGRGMHYNPTMNFGPNTSKRASKRDRDTERGSMKRARDVAAVAAAKLRLNSSQYSTSASSFHSSSQDRMMMLNRKLHQRGTTGNSMISSHGLAVAPSGVPDEAQRKTLAHVQEIFRKITPSIGPYFVVPSGFEVKHWNEIMQALTSGTTKGLSWALNTLAVVVYDARCEVSLAKLPGLLEALVTVVNSCVVEYPVGRSYKINVKAENKDAFKGPPSESGVTPAAAIKRMKKPASPGKIVDTDHDNCWWWTLESYEIVAPDEETMARSTQAVSALRIIRNLSFSRANAQYIVGNFYCLGCLVRCLGPDLLYRHGTNGSQLRFASLDTLSNIGACLSLPKLGMLGKGLMQQVAILLGAPVMMNGGGGGGGKGGRGENSSSSDEENDDKVNLSEGEEEGEDDFSSLNPTSPKLLIRGAVLACDLLSQLSLGQDNSSALSTESGRLGIIAWLVAFLSPPEEVKAQKEKGRDLLCAAVSALYRLASLPGRERLMRQRFLVERLVKLTTLKDVPQMARHESCSILKLLNPMALAQAQLEQAVST